MRIVHGTLVMVADGAKLLLLRNEGDARYAVLETLAHEELRNPATREQGEDAPGRSFASTGKARSSYSETDWHQQAEDDFARHATERLERAAVEHPAARIVVIAAPRTLGVLRQAYGRATTAQLQAEIAKDLAGHTTDDVIAVLEAHDAA